MPRKEKDYYKDIQRKLIEADLDGCMEVKLVRGGTFSPSIVEKAQVFILMTSGLASHKISDQGLGSKFLDIVICRRKYLVLIWRDFDDKIMVLDPLMSGGELFMKSQKFVELLEQPYVRILG